MATGSEEQEGTCCNSKCAVPNLSTHNGDYENHEKWKVKVQTKLCQHESFEFIDKQEAHKKHLKTSQAVFFLLKIALEDGKLALLIKQCKHTKNPHELMKAVKEHYSNNNSVDACLLNKLIKLTQLQLLPDGDISAFTSDFLSCVKHLQDTEPAIKDVNATLCAFLVNAILVTPG